VRALKSVQSADGTVVLATPGADVSRLLHVTGLDTIFRIAPDVAAACREITRTGLS